MRARREEDAKAARERWLPEASAVGAWLNHEVAQHYGLDIDYIAVSPLAGVTSERDALSRLRAIADLHPNAGVRKKARALWESIENAYGDISDRVHLRESEMDYWALDRDAFLGWINDVEALIEKMHAAVDLG